MTSMPGRTDRTPLSREAIVAAGLRIAAAEGVAALTMRRVAAELGSAPMSLYRHVADKRALVLLVLDEVAARVPALPEGGPPDERLVAVFTTVHDHLRAYPWGVQVLAEGELFAPRALQVFERTLAALEELGVHGDDAVHGYALLWNYVLGHLAGSHAADPEVRERRLALMAQAPLDQLPRLRAVLEAGRPYDDEAGFAFALRTIVRGLRAPG